MEPDEFNPYAAPTTKPGADLPPVEAVELTSVHPFVSNSSRAWWAVAFLFGNIVLNLVGAGSNFAQAGLLAQAAAGQAFTPEEAASNDNRQAIVTQMEAVVYLVTAVLVCMWIYRAYRNLPAIGARGLQYSPGWAVGYFFVPFLNLVRPYQVVREIWKASDPEAGDTDPATREAIPSTPLIDWWWGLWILSQIAANIAFRVGMMGRQSLQGLVASSWTGMAVDLLEIIPALLLILIIRKINDRQEEKYRQLAGGVGGGHPDADLWIS